MARVRVRESGANWYEDKRRKCIFFVIGGVSLVGGEEFVALVMVLLWD